MTAHDDRPVFLTIRELAERWRYSERQIRRLLKHQRIGAHRFGRSWRIALEDVEAYEALCRRPRRPFDGQR